MFLRIRQSLPDNQIPLEVITQIIPIKMIESMVIACGVQEKRRRKLPAVLVVLLCIVMNLYTEEALDYLLFKLVRPLRLLANYSHPIVAGKSAISMGRSRVGVRPFAALFRQLCQPIATPETVGAFARFLRPIC